MAVDGLQSIPFVCVVMWIALLSTLATVLTTYASLLCATQIWSKLMGNS